MVGYPSGRIRHEQQGKHASVSAFPSDISHLHVMKMKN